MNWSDRPNPDNTGQLAMPLNNAQMLTQFIQEVNLQEKYNRNGYIPAIPIMVFYDFVQDKNMVYTPDKSFTDIGLFSNQMKYLHDNGFTILRMSDLAYIQLTTIFMLRVFLPSVGLYAMTIYQKFLEKLIIINTYFIYKKY
jgi:hypothetical protein